MLGVLAWTCCFRSRLNSDASGDSGGGGVLAAGVPGFDCRENGPWGAVIFFDKVFDDYIYSIVWQAQQAVVVVLHKTWKERLGAKYRTLLAC